MEHSIVRVSENLHGRPMVHVEPAPLRGDGVPECSESLAQVISPYIGNADNVSVRYLDSGLPTTMLAVVSTYNVGDDEFFITYEVRIALFETENRQVGSNLHLRPIRRGMFVTPDLPIFQVISGARSYEFREAYKSVDDAQNDLERLATLAHTHFCRYE